MLTIIEVAAQVGIPRGTLSRKLLEFNKAAPETEQLKPDKVEDHGHYKVHFFSAETADRIEAMIKASKRKQRLTEAA